MDGFDDSAVPPAQNGGTKGCGYVKTVVGTKDSISRSPHTEMAGVTLKHRDRKASLTPPIRSCR